MCHPKLVDVCTDGCHAWHGEVEGAYRIAQAPHKWEEEAAQACVDMQAHAGSACNLWGWGSWGLGAEVCFHMEDM